MTSISAEVKEKSQNNGLTKKTQKRVLRYGNLNLTSAGADLHWETSLSEVGRDGPQRDQGLNHVVFSP